MAGTALLADPAQRRLLRQRTRRLRRLARLRRPGSPSSSTSGITVPSSSRSRDPPHPALRTGGPFLAAWVDRTDLKRVLVITQRDPRDRHASRWRSRPTSGVLLLLSCCARPRTSAFNPPARRPCRPSPKPQSLQPTPPRGSGPDRKIVGPAIGGALMLSSDPGRVRRQRPAVCSRGRWLRARDGPSSAREQEHPTTGRSSGGLCRVPQEPAHVRRAGLRRCRELHILPLRHADWLCSPSSSATARRAGASVHGIRVGGLLAAALAGRFDGAGRWC